MSPPFDINYSAPPGGVIFLPFPRRKGQIVRRFGGKSVYLCVEMATGQHITKTNAARLLEAAGVSFELVPYEVDENNLAADHVAEQLGEPIEQVFKTLVLRGDRNGLFVCVMPGDMEVDLKVAAKISGNKSAAMIHMKELLPETGYIRGGCSPIGMKKPLPTFIHESALLYDYIYISAGVRGLQFKINPEDLISFVGAELYPL